MMYLFQIYRPHRKFSVDSLQINEKVKGRRNIIGLHRRSFKPGIIVAQTLAQINDTGKSTSCIYQRTGKC